jgi:hypothetical protein
MLDEAVINDLPIPQVWEWIALRELTSIVHGLVSEGFDSPGDLIDRLDSVSEAIAQFEQMGRMAAFGSLHHPPEKFIRTRFVVDDPKQQQEVVVVQSRKQLDLLEEQGNEE